MEVPQKNKNRVAIWSSNPTPGHITEKTNSKRYMHPCVHSSTIHNSNTWKQLKCPSSDEWIKKTRYIYAMEYYLVIKKNKIMSYAAIWMDLEIIILSEVVQKEKDKYHIISLNMESTMWHKWTYLRNRNRLSDIEHKLVVAKRVEGEEQGWIMSLGLANANHYT